MTANTRRKINKNKHPSINPGKFSALSSGMKSIRKFGPDLSIKIARYLIKTQPEVIINLPPNVVGITIQTNDGKREIDRQTMQESQIPQNPVYWTWDQVEDYYTK